MVRRLAVPLVLAAAVALPGRSRAAPLTRTAPPPDAPGRAFDQTHAAWTAILEADLHRGAFDYAAVAKAPGPLDAYLERLEGVTKAEYQAFTRPQQIAFWVNAYNAYTVWLVARRWPVTRLKRTGHFWESAYRIPFIPMENLEGRTLSLDGVAHQILGARFADPRIHLALACAAASCPTLRRKAYDGAHLDAELEAKTRHFLSRPEACTYDAGHETLWLSRIFDWYDGDFRPSVKAFVLRYLPEKTRVAIRLAADRLRIRYLPFDPSVPAAAPTPGIR